MCKRVCVCRCPTCDTVGFFNSSLLPAKKDCGCGRRLRFFVIFPYPSSHIFVVVTCETLWCATYNVLLKNTKKLFPTFSHNQPGTRYQASPWGWAGKRHDSRKWQSEKTHTYKKVSLKWPFNDDVFLTTKLLSFFTFREQPMLKCWRVSNRKEDLTCMFHGGKMCLCACTHTVSVVSS